MGWGSLTSAQQILVRLYMMGGPQYKREMIEAGAATGILTKEQQKLALAQAETTQRTWLQNQALFTARRFLFYGTLGLVGFGAEALRMGLNYQNAMNTATVAMRPFMGSTQAMNIELGKLFAMAAASPFQFKDMTTAFRNMYANFKPAGISVGQTNDTIQAVIDNLSAMGKATPSNLNRVSTALAHMVAIGRPMGQQITQLARDNLQIWPALRVELGLTGDQIKNIATSGITSLQVIQAYDKYIESSPLYSGQALKQANQTLTGAFTTFKDFLSQSVGQGEGGIFGWMRKTLAGINEQLWPTARRGRPIGLTQFAEAIDKQLSPKSLLIINLFVTLETTLKTVYNIFHGIWWVIQQVSKALEWMSGGLFGAHTGAKLLGTYLGVLIAGFLLLEGTMLGLNLALDAFKLLAAPFRVAMFGAGVVKDMMGIGKIMDSWYYSGGHGGLGIIKLAKAWRDYARDLTNTGPLARLGRLLFVQNDGVGLLESSWSKLTGLWDKATGAAVRLAKAIWSSLSSALSWLGDLLWTKVIKRFALWIWEMTVGAAKAVAEFVATIYNALIPALLDLIGVETIADILNPLMWLAIGVAAVAAIVLLYYKWRWFHNFVNHSIDFIRKHWLDALGIMLMTFGFMLGPVGWLIGAGILLYNHWKPFKDLIDWIWSKLKDIYNWLKGPLGFVEHLGHVFGIGSNKVSNPSQLPSWARSRYEHEYGNRAQMRQTVPAGHRQLIPQAPGVTSVANFIRQGEGGGKDINVNLVVDRQVLAKAVARANQDYAARR